MKLTKARIMAITIVKLVNLSKAEDFTILSKFLVGRDAPEDKDTVLNGDATWELPPPPPQGLRLSGSGLATVPATPFEKDDFTISIWVYAAPNIDREMYVYANWKRFRYGLWSFRINLQPNKNGYEVVAQFRRQVTSMGYSPPFRPQALVGFTGGFVPAQTWKHIAVTWNRAAGVLRLYIDGKFEVSGFSTVRAGNAREVQSNGSPVHEVGFKADSLDSFFVGQLRELVIARGLIVSD